MAVVADIDNLDLVVEPHEDTPQDREAFLRAVEQRRDRQLDAQLSEEAGRLLARGTRTRSKQMPSGSWRSRGREWRVQFSHVNTNRCDPGFVPQDEQRAMEHQVPRYDGH